MLFMLLFWIIPFDLSTCGNAQAISCTVTQEAGQTRYGVPEFSGTECYYSWTNGSGYVVANHEDKYEYPVVTQSIITLTTQRCLEEIHYMRDCISEGIRHEVTCSTNCSGNAGPSDIDREIHHYYWIVAAAAAAAVVLLVVLVVYLISICRKCHCYNFVKSTVEAP